MQEISRETFSSEVMESELPVLLDFWGPQCVPCLELMPAVEELAREYEGRLKVCKVEAPKNRRLCVDLRVVTLPTFLIFANGVEAKRLTGNVTREQLLDAAHVLAADATET